MKKYRNMQRNMNCGRICTCTVCVEPSTMKSIDFFSGVMSVWPPFCSTLCSEHGISCVNRRCKSVSLPRYTLMGELIRLGNLAANNQVLLPT